jgi:hypothetical protein
VFAGLPGVAEPESRAKVDLAIVSGVGTPSNAEAKDLITLAGRMSIPADEAMRHVTHLIDTSDVGIENTDVLRTVRVAEVTPHS